MNCLNRSNFLKNSSIIHRILPSTSNSLLPKRNSVNTVSESFTEEVVQDVLPLSQMPGPKYYPIFGSELALLMHKDFDKRRFYKVFDSFFREYGKIFQMKARGRPNTIFISRPEDIEQLHRVTMENPIRHFFVSLKSVRNENVKYFENKTGLITENHEKWQRVRSKVQAPMLRPKNLVKYLPQMDETTLDFIEIIAEYQRNLGEMPPHFLNDLYKWAFESISTVALSRRLGCFESNLPEDSMQMQMINSVNECVEAMNITEIRFPFWKFFATPSYEKLRKGHNTFLRFADEIIRETEKDLLTKKSSKDAGEMTLMETLLNTDGITRNDVVTIVLDMLFAGIDTTSHTVAFTLYLLSKNQDKQRKLQEEIDKVLGDGKEKISENHLAKLSYLKCCVKEALRIFPIVFGVSRDLERDAVFSRYLVPKGCRVQICSLSSTLNEDNFLFSKRFIPERWGRDAPLGPIHPFASLPFSFGPRMCIGKRISEQEVYVFLARVFHRFSVHYHYKDIEILTKLVFTPSEPLRFQFVERS